MNCESGILWWLLNKNLSPKMVNVNWKNIAGQNINF